MKIEKIEVFVIGAFNVRGGIHTTVSATYEAQKKKSKPKIKNNSLDTAHG